MTFYTFPARNDLPWYQFTISLSGVLFECVMRFNTRMNRWIIDFRDPSGNPILLGIPVLIERNLTGQYTTLAIPSGDMFATDDTNQQTQPTQFSFGVDHTFWYVDKGT